MGDVFDFEGLVPGAAGEEEGDEAEGEEVANLHSAASEGEWGLVSTPGEGYSALLVGVGAESILLVGPDARSHACARAHTHTHIGMFACPPSPPLTPTPPAGDATKLQELLAAEAVDVDEQDEEGRTALHFAAGYGELECAKLLLDKVR